MAKWARVDGTRIKILYDEQPTLQNSSQKWLNQVIEIPKNLQPFVTTQYTYQNNQFIPPSLQYVKDTIHRLVHEKRRDMLNKGYTVPGTDIRILTGNDDRILINGAYSLIKDQVERLTAKFVSEGATLEDAKAQALSTTNYFMNGYPRQLSNALVIQIGYLTGCYVQACFNRQGYLYDLINTCSTVEEAIDIYHSEIEAGWVLPDTLP